MSRRQHKADRRRSPRVRVAIVDDAEMVRAGLRSIFRAAADIAVVAEAASAAEARYAIADTRPDVALIDIVLPDGDGIALCEQLLAATPGLQCVVLSDYVDQEAVARAERAGVRAYLTKDAAADALLAVVRQAARGARIRLRGADHLRNPPVVAAERRLAALSPQERRMAYLIGDGLTNRQIAEQMGWTERTAKNYMSRILAKLNLRRRTQVLRLVAQARHERAQQPVPPLPSPSPDRASSEPEDH